MHLGSNWQKNAAFIQVRQLHSLVPSSACMNATSVGLGSRVFGDPPPYEFLRVICWGVCGSVSNWEIVDRMFMDCRLS